MKKIPYAIAVTITVALTFVSCSKDDNPPVQINQVEQELSTLLNGKFYGAKKESAANIWDCQEITFYPYDTPKREQYKQYGDYVSIDKNIIMFGECDVVKYYLIDGKDGRLMESFKHLKYSIKVAYNGAQPRLYLYPDFYGIYEFYEITKKSSSSFEMDGILYNRQ